MWNSVNKVWGFLFGRDDTDGDDELIASVYKELKQELDANKKPRTAAQTRSEENSDTKSEYTCVLKSGIITDIVEGVCHIDNVYTYPFTHTPSALVGFRVAYTQIREKNSVRVTKVNLVDGEDWSLDVTSADRGQRWFRRVHTSQVSQRRGRTLVLFNFDTPVDLDMVECDFAPLSGDWVEVVLKCELDEHVLDLGGRVLEVEVVRPVRPHIRQCKIKRWNPGRGEGVLDFDVYFDRAALQDDYLPMVGDQVTANVIESTQNTCSYRAVNIVVTSINSSKSIELPSTVGYKNLSNWKENLNGVFIGEDITATATSFGSQVQITITIRNNTDGVIRLLGMQNYSNCPQIIIKDRARMNILIHPKIETNVIVWYQPRLVGLHCELLLFTFDVGIVGRYVELKFDCTEKSRSLVGQIGKYKRTDYHLVNVDQESRNFCPGRNAFQKPRFGKNRLPRFNLPQVLLDVLTETPNMNRQDFYEKVLKLYPLLGDELSFDNYNSFFHALLYLEEIVLKQAFARYQIEHVCFVRNDKYLMVEIPNLAEQRPSIIAGDRVYARDVFQTDFKEYEGFIHKITGNFIYIQFAEIFHDRYNNEDYSIHVEFTRSNFMRLHYAVDEAKDRLGRDFLFPSKMVHRDAQVEFTYTPYEDDMRNHVLDSDVSGSRENCSTQKETNCKNCTRAVTRREFIERLKAKVDENNLNSNNVAESKLLLTEPTDTNNANTAVQHSAGSKQLKWFNRNLNFYQKEAVRNILLGHARPLPYFIFGPPGTGKTVTIIETILQLVTLMPNSRLIVGTPSNSAADLIGVRLIESGALLPGDMIRLLSVSSIDRQIPSILAPYCGVISIAKDYTTRFETTRSGLTMGLTSSIIGRHRITVGTCGVLGQLASMGFPSDHFTHVILDEAGQATEPDALMALININKHSGQAVMAGDPKQLGPVTLMNHAKLNMLSETLFDRLLSRFPYARDVAAFPETDGCDPRLITQLVYNYRALSSLLELPNKMFYRNKLRATINSVTSDEAILLNSLREILPPCHASVPLAGLPTMIFHGMNSNDSQTADSPSWFNVDEATQVFFYVNDLYRLGLGSADIGIIAPYIKQVAQIRALITEAEYPMPKVGSVEEFQGQEFPVIILSTVRSQKSMISFDQKHTLGFLSNPRRINVAITRAKSLLIIVGNPKLLRVDKHWYEVIKSAIVKNCYIGCAIE